MHLRHHLLCTFFLFAFSSSLMATTTLRGTVTTVSGPAPGVTVELSDSNATLRTTTNEEGAYFFNNIAAGDYQLKCTAVGLLPFEETIKVENNTANVMNVVLVASANVMESMTVASASRRPERIVEAPAAVTVITQRELEQQTTSGQIPSLLNATPGVEITQSGVYDFNLNARGFNSSLNRRVLVLIDGRDPATGFLGNQEWSALSLPIEEFSSLEFIRGPGSALYGANAYNGVLNIRSKRPSDNLGGYATVSAGELSSFRGDVRFAFDLGNRWYLRVNGGAFQSDTWDESRTIDRAPFEYPGLSPERVGFGDGPGQLEEENKGVYGGFRLDKEFSFGHVFTAEAGTSTTENVVTTTGIGRVHVGEAERPWFRLNYNMPHFNIMAWRSERDTPEPQTSLAANTGFYEKSSQTHFEVQTNYDFMDGKIDLVAGVSYHEQDVDTAAPNGFQTLMIAPRKEDQQALFGQLSFALHEKVDLVVAARYDDSSLHDSQTSPKGALVYKITPNHSLRATYNKAFQTPNYSEFFLRAPSTPIPFNLFEAGFEAQAGIDLPLNWREVPVMALGNDQLEVEENETYEIGYKGIVNDKLFVTLDYYKSNLTNFVTDLLPGVNPAIPQYTFPAGIPAQLQPLLLGVINGNLPPGFGSGLSIGTPELAPFIPLGHPVIIVSYTNAGDVDLDGIEFGFNYYLDDQWTLHGTYSSFDFTVNDQQAGDRLVPNASDLKYNLGFSYSNGTFTAGLDYKHVDGFDWAAGTFVGVVPDYDLVTLNSEYRFNDTFRVTLNVTNLTDDEHYEIFGGALLGRRALVGLHINF